MSKYRPTKSEKAFDDWYIPLREDPQPSEIWDQAIEWAKKTLLKNAFDVDGYNASAVWESDIVELTK